MSEATEKTRTKTVGWRLPVELVKKIKHESIDREIPQVQLVALILNDALLHRPKSRVSKKTTTPSTVPPSHDQEKDR